MDTALGKPHLGGIRHQGEVAGRRVLDQLVERLEKMQVEGGLLAQPVESVPAHSMVKVMAAVSPWVDRARVLVTGGEESRIIRKDTGQGYRGRDARGPRPGRGEVGQGRAGHGQGRSGIGGDPCRRGRPPAKAAREIGRRPWWRARGRDSVPAVRAACPAAAHA